MELPSASGMDIRKALLDAKGIKTVQKFEREMGTYFLPAGFGVPELFYERDFDHEPSAEIAAPEPLITDRMQWVGELWRPRLLDLGDFQLKYEEQLQLEPSAL